MVTSTAPAASRRPPARAAPLRGSTRTDRTQTAIPIGTLTRKIQCHVSRSVRTPPSSTPSVPPPAATNPNTPIAFTRSAGSTNSDTISDSDTADTIAPPNP